VPVLSILQRAFKYDSPEARLFGDDPCTLEIEHGQTVYQSETKHVEGSNGRAQSLSGFGRLVADAILSEQLSNISPRPLALGRTQK
jgi:hypothetical protein